MNRLVWLASFPKSGNTWVRAFLSAYQGDDAENFDLNHLDQSLHSGSRVLFDRITGLYASDLTPQQVDRLRPEMYRCLSAEQSAPQFVKVHDRWRRNDRGEAVFAADATRVAVLIVRNPLSVVASYASHYGLGIDESIAAMADEELALAKPGSGLAPQLHQPVGSWSSHTLSWLDQTELPVHLLRYEDLRTDPQPGFSGLLRAAGIEVDPARLERAIEATRFDRLQAAERQGGFRERRHQSQGFFRSGRSDGWREELGREQRRAVIERHGAVMKRLGYDIDEALC